MDPHHMILEMVYMIKDYALRLIYRMVADHLLIYRLVFQMNVFHMVHHMRDTGEGSCPFIIQKLLVPNADDTLGGPTDEGKCSKLWEWVGSKSRKLLFKRLLIAGG
jgi:hypothetical protein